MMNPVVSPVVMGPGGVGYVMGGGYVMGAPAPHIAQLPAHHPAQAHGAIAHLPPVHLPPWLHQPMLAPGMPTPQENRKILPFAASNGTGIFAAVTDRISFIAQPQKRFLGERPVFTISKTGDNGKASSVLCSLFAVGTNPQSVELGDFGVEDFTGDSLDMNMKFDPCEPGVRIRFDLFLVGPAFTPGDDAVFVSIKALGRSLG